MQEREVHSSSLLILDEVLKHIHSAGINVDSSRERIMRALDLVGEAAAALRREAVETTRKIDAMHTEMMSAAARVAQLEQQVLAYTEHLASKRAGGGNGAP